MSAPAFDHDWIAARIPHAGRMCLLDTVVDHDAEAIHCRARSHRDADNPMRHAGRLGAAVGVEYAAQAMAVHGAILQPPENAPGIGYLASVRSVRLHVERLDTIEAPLDITARRLSGDDSTILYSFELCAAGRPLLEGRAAVIMNPDLPATGEGSS